MLVVLRLSTDHCMISPDNCGINFVALFCTRSSLSTSIFSTSSLVSVRMALVYARSVTNYLRLRSRPCSCNRVGDSEPRIHYWSYFGLQFDKFVSGDVDLCNSTLLNPDFKRLGCCAVMFSTVPCLHWRCFALIPYGCDYCHFSSVLYSVLNCEFLNIVFYWCS